MSKKNDFKLDIKTADNMLQNVFAACEVEPNKIPLDSILKKTKLTVLSDNILIAVAGIFLLMLLIVPLTIPYADFRISVSSDSNKIFTVTDHEVTNDEFIFSFSGDAIDTASSYMEDTAGNIYEIAEYTRSTNTVSFSVDHVDEYNIFIYDVNGERLHLLMTPKTQK